MNVLIEKSNTTRINQVDKDNLGFGVFFTDHMFVCEYKNGGWNNAKITPYKNLSVAPSLRVFHYGQAVFEGMKAYKDRNDSVWLFRPEQNIRRLNKSAKRLKMPGIPEELFLKALNDLLVIDKDWFFLDKDSTMYIRPFIIATEESIMASQSNKYLFIIICSPSKLYYSKPISVEIAEKYSRSANGGVGFVKAAGNYAGQFYPTSLAQKNGFDQVIWTDDSTHRYIEEAGTMNIMVRIEDKIITPPISDRLLDGITRKSLIELAKSEDIEIEERKISINELIEAHKKGSLKEMFGCGTAVIISRINKFGYQGKCFDINEQENAYSTFLKEKLLDLQHNRIEDKFGWRKKVL